MGRNFVQDGNDQWIYGVSSEIEFDGLELLGELHGQKSEPPPTELIVEMGGRQKLSRQLFLLAAVGRAVHGVREERPNLRLYLGIQFNLPKQYPFSSQTQGP